LSRFFHISNIAYSGHQDKGRRTAPKRDARLARNHFLSLTPAGKRVLSACPWTHKGSLSGEDGADSARFYTKPIDKKPDIAHSYIFPSTSLGCPEQCLILSFPAGQLHSFLTRSGLSFCGADLFAGHIIKGGPEHKPYGSRCVSGQQLAAGLRIVVIVEDRAEQKKRQAQGTNHAKHPDKGTGSKHRQIPPASGNLSGTLSRDH
jgi:hypothetical protein